jgi:hypothetical protein
LEEREIFITMNLWPTRGCLLAQEAATTEASGEVAVAWRSKGRPPGAGRGAEAAIHMEKSLGEETEWRSDLFVRSGSVSGRGGGGYYTYEELARG